MWNEINNDRDLNNFMDIHYGFHDSCVKELKYISGAYVYENLSMHTVNDQRVLKIIIQRQFNKPSARELEFTGLKYLKMFPNDENYTCEILGATMILKEDCVLWCDCGDLSEDELISYEGTLICAEKVRWRPVDEYIGPQEIYTAR